LLLVKHVYAVNVWWGFTSAAGRLRLVALAKCDIRTGFHAYSVRYGWIQSSTTPWPHIYCVI